MKYIKLIDAHKDDCNVPVLYSLNKMCFEFACVAELDALPNLAYKYIQDTKLINNYLD